MRFEFHKPKKHWKGSWKLSLAAGLIGIAGALSAHIIYFDEFEKRLNPKKGLESKVVQEHVSKVNDINEVRYVVGPKYSQEDKKLITNTLYGESANQSRLGRKLIARMTLNRVREPEYPSNIRDVIYEHLAISCIKDKKNLNWKQATGKLPRNEYEEMIYKRCGEDTRFILDGGKLGIPYEDEIIAYHDTSIKYEDLVAKEKKIQEKWKKRGKTWEGYWMHLEPVMQEDDLIFYKERD